MGSQVLPDRRPDRPGPVSGDDLDVERPGGSLLAEEPIKLQQRFMNAKAMQVQPGIVAGRSAVGAGHGSRLV